MSSIAFNITTWGRNSYQEEAEQKRKITVCSSSEEVKSLLEIINEQSGGVT
jgi:hypothetical protein